MIKLQIRKKTARVWQHFITDGENFILSKCYCKTNGDKFRVVEDGGTAKKEYLFSEIEVYDDLSGGSAETFTSSLQLMNRLSALNYVGFSKDGDVITADLISSDSSNALIEGADGKLYVPIVNTSSFATTTQLNEGLALKENTANKTDAQTDFTSTTKFWSIKGVVDYFTSRWVAASLLVSGIVTTGTQSFSGNKTIRGESNTIGNAFEVQNLSGNKLLEVLNTGFFKFNYNGIILGYLSVNGSLEATSPYNFIGGTGSTAGKTLRVGSTGGLGVDGASANSYFAGNLRIGAFGIPPASAVLDVVSTTRGSLTFQRMTEAQRLAIVYLGGAPPAVGLQVYQTDGVEGVYIHKSTGWQFAY
jgi:hypothetical protein